MDSYKTRSDNLVIVEATWLVVGFNDHSSWTGLTCVAWLGFLTLWPSWLCYLNYLSGFCSLDWLLDFLIQLFGLTFWYWLFSLTLGLDFVAQLWACLACLPGLLHNTFQFVFSRFYDKCRPCQRAKLEAHCIFLKSILDTFWRFSPFTSPCLSTLHLCPHLFPSPMAWNSYLLSHVPGRRSYCGISPCLRCSHHL